MNPIEISQMLAQMSGIDLANNPALRFKAHLRHILIGSHGFPVDQAELLVARMIVELGSNPIDEMHLQDWARHYGKLIVNMREAYSQAGFTYPEKAVLEAAGQLTLKMS